MLGRFVALADGVAADTVGLVEAVVDALARGLEAVVVADGAAGGLIEDDGGEVGAAAPVSSVNSALARGSHLSRKA